MDFFYIDESSNTGSARGKPAIFILSALKIPAEQWNESFQEVLEFRRKIKALYGVYIRKELHARELVKGEGRIAPPNIVVTKHQRSIIFFQALRTLAALPEASLINVCLEKKGRINPVQDAYERLFNRIQANLRASRKYGICIFDKGKERPIAKLLRKMRVFNLIPSRFGAWRGGDRVRHIATDRILEDPFFKDSADSFFIQMVDMAAFALLKRELPPTPHVARYNLDRGFRIIAPILCREASREDPEGIVRR
jgi:hypothetical protein